MPTSRRHRCRLLRPYSGARLHEFIAALLAAKITKCLRSILIELGSDFAAIDASECDLLFSQVSLAWDHNYFSESYESLASMHKLLH
jgi:hypothetical protein